MMDLTLEAGSVCKNVPVLPKRCEIELSAACNLHCRYCPRQFFENLSSFMDFNLFKRIIDELEPYPETKLVLHRRGESLLHPRFSECLDYLKCKFEIVQLATNATLLNAEVSTQIIHTVSFISFSIDTPEKFDLKRSPAKYHTVEKKIHQFLALNDGRIETQVSMVRTPETPSENLERFKQIWKGKVNRIRIYEAHSVDGKFGSLSRNRGKRLSCTMPFYEMAILSDGNVARCNHDWNGRPMGNVNENSIKEIWGSPGYNELRTQHLNLTLTDPACRECDSWYPVTGMQMTGETYVHAS
jgi:radical SAM protein with 4Fe4S-binding SPASM domain